MRLYRHKKRGTIYRVIEPGEPIPLGSTVKMQVENSGDDGCEAVIYARVPFDNIVWVRGEHWFYDGRFEEVTDAPIPAPD